MPGASQEPLRLAGRTVIPVDTAEAYLRYARDAGRPDAALPVLAGDWERLRTALAALPTVARISRRPWHGSVFVCDEEYAAVAETLAAATGRPLVHAPFQAALAHGRTEPVTVVAGVSAVTPERIAAIPSDARVGLFVTRTPAAASALVVRTLLHGPAAAESRPDLSFDAASAGASAPGRLMGVHVTPEALREAIGPGVAMLTGRSHARDCVLHLNGGGICGRAFEDPVATTGLLDAAGFREHPTSCQQGQGCWRADVEVGEHLRAAELRAAFTVLDGCRLAVAGEGAVRADVSVPLTMLENSAVAVTVGTGIRKGVPNAGPLFRALTRAGLPLGEALAEVNGVIDTDPDAMGRLVLFGDAGLAPVPEGTVHRVRCSPDGAHIPARAEAVLVEGGPVIAEDTDGPVVLTRPDGVSCWALTTAAGRLPGRVAAAAPRFDDVWAGRVSGWLDRLGMLETVGVAGDFGVLDTVRKSAEQALHGHAVAVRADESRAAAAAFDEAVRELARFQTRLVAGEVDWIGTNFSGYADGWRRPWVVTTDDELRTCPQCGARTAAGHRVRPAAGAAGELLHLICSRCGDVLAGSRDFDVEVEVLLPSEVRRGTEFTLGVVLTAPADRAVYVSAGAAISNEPVVHCKLAATTEVELRPGERTTVEFTGTSDARLTRPDQHPLRVVVAADGAVRCWTRALWLRA
ncbi:hypothetical protein [Streptomyces misionensis]|uniref:hypothetical protein n=1 Tax=Streptomyces misionensis TaxID=67331 RepID=UPI0036BA9A6D